MSAQQDRWEKINARRERLARERPLSPEPELLARGEAMLHHHNKEKRRRPAGMLDMSKQYLSGTRAEARGAENDNFELPNDGDVLILGPDRGKDAPALVKRV